MKRIPTIGDRVKYTGPSDMFKGAEGLVDRIFYPIEDEGISVGVIVDDPLPEYWPYLDTNKFAPALEEIELSGE